MTARRRACSAPMRRGRIRTSRPTGDHPREPLEAAPEALLPLRRPSGSPTVAGCSTTRLLDRASREPRSWSESSSPCGVLAAAMGGDRVHDRSRAHVGTRYFQSQVRCAAIRRHGALLPRMALTASREPETMTETFAPRRVAMLEKTERCRGRSWAARFGRAEQRRPG